MSFPTQDELRWRQSMLENCLDKVRQDPTINADTIEIFIAYAVEEHTVQDVAQKYGIKENAVYQIKNRMIKRLARELEFLFPEDERSEP